MTKLALQTNLEPWTLEKPSVRPDRSNSAASTPQSIRSDQFEIRPGNLDLDDNDLHTRYLSSEEDISSDEFDMAESILEFEDDVEFVEFEEARAIPITNPKFATIPQMPQMMPQKGQLAQLVYIVTAERPTLVDIPPSLGRKSARNADSNSHRMTRLSTSTSDSSRASDRHSISSDEETKHIMANYNALHGAPTSRLSISETSEEEQDWYSTSSRSDSRRRQQTPPSFSKNLQSKRNPSTHPPSRPVSSFFPSTSDAPNAHSFLNSDPFSETSRSSASPTINQSNSTTHKSLRSISRSITLAKVAINKKTERKDKEYNYPVTPRSTFTPMTAVHPTTPSNKRRLVPRDAKEERSTSMTADLVDFLDRAPTPIVCSKPQARDAADRSAPFELQPYHAANDASSSYHDPQPRIVRRRKSRLGLRKN